MKFTPFHPFHLQEGAKMVPFAGYEMPLEYSGIKQEHNNVREKAGLFDVSHMGEIWIKGSGAFELVQKLTSNDIQVLEPGKIQYSCFPNHDGGIVDDLLVYCYEKEKYLLVVNASNLEKDHQWILDNNDTGAQVENASEAIAQLAVQGPRATELLQELTDVNLSDIPYYHFQTGKMAGVEEVIISNTGYTGAGGFELYVYNADAPQLWEEIFRVGKKYGLEATGLAARDTLRLEMGFCLYGNDINANTSPLEAGLGWITKFVDGNDFINRPALEKQKAEGIERRLVGFELKDRGIARQHYSILDDAGNEIGEVTSGTMSPFTGKSIGMGYVQKAYTKKGTAIKIGVRNKQLSAEVTKTPFL